MIPKSKSVPSTYTIWPGYGKPVVTKIQCPRIVSDWAQRTKTPFIYRGPTQLIDGVLYLDGELYGSDAAGNSSSFKAFKQAYGKNKSYEDFQIAMKRNMWRNPTPYTANIVDGMHSTIQGTLQHFLKDNPELGITSYTVGEAPFGNFEMDLPVSAPLPFDSGLENRAVAKVLGKLKSQDVDLSVAFAERAQTVDLVASTLRGLIHAARSLRKGNLKEVARGLGLRGLKGAPKGRNFHDKWLELQYGWRPLYSDVYGAVKALHDKDMEDKNRYMFTTVGSVKEPRASFDWHGRGTAVEYYERVEGVVGCFVRLDYYVTNPLTGTLASLGITNPLVPLWEITPFSFVWDWFNPIGQYLTCIDASAGKELRGGTVTNWSKSTREVGFRGVAYPEFGSIAASGQGLGSCRTMAMQRRVLSSFPSARLPGFKNPFPGPSNPAHLQNLIALFASSAKGRKIART